MTSLRIALLGSRGVPARYGGYETLLEELGKRLVDAGHDVTVYCRSRYTRREESPYLGMRLVVLPTLPTKHFDTPVHTLLSCLHTWGRGYDAALVVNGANALFLPLLRLGRLPTALHVDGMPYGIDRTGKFSEMTVTSRFEYTSAIFRDFWVDNLGPQLIVDKK